MATRLAILGSGSAGNSAYLETEKTRILIDAGFSCAQIKSRLEILGRSPADLDAILVTHEHGDHVRGIKVLHSRFGVPVFANRLTHEWMERQFDCSIQCHRFETGHQFDIGDIRVESFHVPHDAQDPVGFAIRTPGAMIGFLTDLGHVTAAIQKRIEDAHALVLEANYDQRMLEEDMVRPWSVKQRIMSRHGHLSNEDAGNLAGKLAIRSLEHLYLGHLSRDCNTPQKARDCITASMIRETLVIPEVYSTSQESPSDWLTLA